MAQPLFARLRQSMPELELDAFAPAWVAPALSRMPEISRIVANPFAHGELALGKRFRLARELARDYRQAYVLPNSFKSALLPFFAGIRERIGFTGEARFGLVNIRHRLDEKALPLMVERFAQLAVPPGMPLPRPVEAPRLCSTPEDQSKTLRELSLACPAPPIVFCPGAEYGPAKRWPGEHFAALARALLQEGHRLWLIGSGKDRAIADAILARLDRDEQEGCLNLCGVTRVDQAIDLIALARLVVCNDSGLMHVAAALDRPTVAIFGSSSPDFTPPLSSHAEVLRAKLSCSPCFKRECPLGHLACLHQLTPDRILAACREHLAQET
jgi:heptosyltransferase-2